MFVVSFKVQTLKGVEQSYLGPSFKVPRTSYFKNVANYLENEQFKQLLNNRNTMFYVKHEAKTS